MRYSYNTTVATSGAGTATFPHHQSSSRVFSGFRVTQSLVFFKVLCRSLFFFFLLAIVLSMLHWFYLSFIFWPLYCLSFTDSICLLSFGHCIVYPSPILFVFYLLAIVLSILHWFYLSFFFWPLCCPSFTDLRLLITSVASSSFSCSISQKSSPLSFLCNI
jgi:hypothetical protein